MPTESPETPKNTWLGPFVLGVSLSAVVFMFVHAIRGGFGGAR